MALYENSCKECGKKFSRLDVNIKSAEKSAFVSEAFRKGELPGMKNPKCGNTPYSMKRIPKK